MAPGRIDFLEANRDFAFDAKCNSGAERSRGPGLARHEAEIPLALHVLPHGGSRVFTSPPSP